MLPEVTAPAQYPEFPSETPAEFVPSTSGHDFARREVMILMRDGVKLRTIILVPRGARQAGILLTRTPYDAAAKVSYTPSGHLGPMLQGFDNAVDVIVGDGYI
ncbi:MAG: CocE/NonD family hydrolase, partial [Rhodanobacteraceae bacterium]